MLACCRLLNGRYTLFPLIARPSHLIFYGMPAQQAGILECFDVRQAAQRIHAEGREKVWGRAERPRADETRSPQIADGVATDLLAKYLRQHLNRQ